MDGNDIHWAVVPIAGMGTRMRPMSYAVPKALLPLADPQGRLRCVLHWILAEAAGAGISQAVVVHSPGQRECLEAYFNGIGADGQADLPERIEWVPQPAARGFGDAVAHARPAVGHQPFLLMLGDHVYLPPAGGPGCVADLLAGWARLEAPSALVGVQVVGRQMLPAVGVCQGRPLGDRLYRCEAIIEKPTAAGAEPFQTPGLPAGRYLAHGGLYVFSPAIFEQIDKLPAAGQRGQEVQLTAAQRGLLDEDPRPYCLRTLSGEVFDTGCPDGYAEAFTRFRAGPPGRRT